MIESRLSDVDWSQVEAGLDAHGVARAGGLLDAEECREIAGLYDLQLALSSPGGNGKSVERADGL
jgi:hypothetical protein